MKVNIPVQCLATLFIPTGLYAFKRIEKLKIGALIYGVTFAVWALQGLVFSPTNPETLGLFGLSSLITLVIGVIVPILFIRQWSLEYNKKIEKENTTFVQ